MRSPGMACEVDGRWRNASFHRDADDALSDDFAAGLQALLEPGAYRRCAIMCAEVLW